MDPPLLFLPAVGRLPLTFRLTIKTRGIPCFPHESCSSPVVSPGQKKCTRQLLTGVTGELSPAVFTSIINGNTNEQFNGGYPVITKTLETALNKQVNRELYSAYLYLSMSAYFETSALKGFAKWMRVQAKEEQMHAMKIYDYVIARGGKVTLLEIEAPKNKWASAAKVFEDTYTHEQKVTGMINGLVDLAIREKDHATFEMLQWFVKEQVEEEEQSLDILNQITCIGDVPGHLFWLDHELGKRE
jgi:ferritin